MMPFSRAGLDWRACSRHISHILSGQRTPSSPYTTGRTRGRERPRPQRGSRHALRSTNSRSTKDGWRRRRVTISGARSRIRREFSLVRCKPFTPSSSEHSRATARSTSLWRKRPLPSRTPRRRSRNPSDLRKHALGAALALLALSALSAGAYVYSTAARPPALDRSSLCPADGPRSISVVLLDSTDDIPAVAKREVKTVLVDMAETLSTYGLLEL